MTSRHVRRAIAASCMVLAIGCAMAPPSRRGAVYAEEAPVRTPSTLDAKAVQAREPTTVAQPSVPSAAAAPGTLSEGSKVPTTAAPPPPAVTGDAYKSEAPRAMPRAVTPTSPVKDESDGVVSASGGSGGSTTTPVASPVPTLLPGPPAIQIAAAQANFDDANRQLGAAGGDCAKLCKALASMQRATERLCGLVAGSNDGEKRRCTDARAKLTAATAKVNATCGNCGA